MTARFLLIPSGGSMKRMRRLTPRAAINITPLIDVLLVLLVIFMTISPSVPVGLDTQIPQPAPTEQDERAQSHVILSIDESGTIRINHDQVERGTLSARLQEILKPRRNRTVFVQADQNVFFEDVARVIDSAKGAG